MLLNQLYSSCPEQFPCIRELVCRFLTYTYIYCMYMTLSLTQDTTACRIGSYVHCSLLYRDKYYIFGYKDPVTLPYVICVGRMLSFQAAFVCYVCILINCK